MTFNQTLLNSLKPSPALRATVLAFLVFLNGSSPLLAQDISGGADLSKDITGGAVGVVKIPRTNKPHKITSTLPLGVAQFQSSARAVKGSSRGGGGRKQTIVTPTPPRPVATAESYNAQGDKFFDAQQYDKAIADFNAALKFNPKQPWTLYCRGVAKVRGGHKQDGETDMAAAMATNPHIAEQAKRYDIGPGPSAEAPRS